MKHTILSLSAAITLLASPALAAAPTCATPDFAQQARALVSDLVAQGRFSGSVLVAKDGVPLLREGFGAADREWNIPNAPDTKFRLASISKQFTAVAILQLAEAGKLSVDDPISKFYPEAPAAWSKVTIKHLLTHSSGIPSYTDLPDFFAAKSRLALPPAQIVKLTQDMPLAFEPGAKFAYDNTGYILLGVVIEKTAGQTYADYMTQHVFQPLGMRNSGYDLSGQILPKRAAGYQPGKSGWENADYLDMSLPYAAGSLYSTVDDLLIWDRALADGKVLSPASRTAMWTDYGHKYGFGWGVDEHWGRPRVSHNGGINGFSTALSRYSKDGLVSIVLANFQGSPSTSIANRLAGLCLGTFQTPKAITLPPATLDLYVGEYQLRPDRTIRIFREGDRLVTQATGQPTASLIATAPGVLYASGPDATLIFAQTGQALAASLTLRQGGKDTVAPRVAGK